MSHLPDDRLGAPGRRRRAPESEHGFGRFVGMTLLGTVLPGAGLLLSDRRKSGATLLGLFVALVLGMSAYLTVSGAQRSALTVALDDNRLLVVTVAAVLVVLVWVASIIWTAVINWPSRPATLKRVFAVVVTTLACLVLVAPTALAVRYVGIQRGLVQSLFPDVTARRSNVNPALGGNNPWADVPRVNVLLVGADSGPERPGLRTDSMMLASIDTATGNTVLFGLPRNLENAPFPPSSPMRKLYPNGYNCGDECLLNAVWGVGEDHPELYPGDPRPGLSALSDAVNGITGLTPDYGIVINMASFQQLVNAMGGVDITVKDRVPIGGKVEHGQIVPGSIKGYIEPGRQHLDGYHAMWYARGRATTNDFDRMKRQRCMVGALVKQVNPALMLERYPQLAQVAKDNIYTNIPQQHLAAWADLATRMQQGTISSLPFSNKVINVVHPDFALMQQMVQASILGQPMPTPTATTSLGPNATPAPTKAPSTSKATPSAPATTAPEGLVKVADAC